MESKVDKKFFEQQTASSKIKAQIISEYFPSYCKIITRANKPRQIRYIDLFAGPGYYEDGNPSTPILVGRRCAKDQELKNQVKLIFNDKEYTEILKSHFYNEFPDGTFTHSPHFSSRIIGEDDLIKNFLIKGTHHQNKNIYPTLLFIDPFGYKGIETLVLAEFLKNWGNEIFLFVNIKRIHPALENDKFEALMQDLFPTTLSSIRNDRRYKSTTAERINLIIQSLGKEYEKVLNQTVYYTAFKFQEEDSQATSHYILHLTKGSRGFDLVKQIYNDFANVGTIFDGINTYTFDSKQIDTTEVCLFDTKMENIDLLKSKIYTKYKGRKILSLDLFDEHQTETLYSRAHYSEALRSLQREGLLTSTFTDGKEHKVSVLISKFCVLNFI